MIRRIVGCLLLGEMLLFTAWAMAAETLEIRHPWVREAPPNARMLAAYLELENRGNQPVVLVSASSPQFETVSFHRSEMHDGMAHMVHEKKVVVPPGGKVRFQPGGRHLMLMHPKHPLRSGGRVTLTLRSEDGREWQVEAPVRKQMEEMEGLHHHGH